MKAISIRQPWAWLIAHGYKDIENRTWNTKFRGPVLIHASSRKPTAAEVDYARCILEKQAGADIARQMPDRDGFDLGGFVGVVTINGTCSSSGSPWFFGPVGFQLVNASRLPFYPYRGRLSFFGTTFTVVPATSQHPEGYSHVMVDDLQFNQGKG